MRSINTSLPQSPRKRRSRHPPVQTIQAFKTAALEVANLYRAAASDHQAARHSGYQEALDDLLAFLDRENIGLDDGEGWRVRQWATERLDDSVTTLASNDSDDEPTEQETGRKSLSPTNHRSLEEEASVKSPTSAPPAQSALHNEPTSSDLTTTTSTSTESTVHSSDEFSFRSNVPYPAEVDMLGSESLPRMQPSTTSRMQLRPQSRANTQTSPLRVEVVSRTSNPSHKGAHNPRPSSKPAVSNRTTTSAVGNKRRITIADLFSLGDLDEFKDIQGGGGKRARFS